jgi:2,4-dienoyl-CoA reductase-like NADH-dependent reductase (Old Yellow Enzyme family)
MSELFKKTSIGAMELDSRAVRSATWSVVCDLEGYVTDREMVFYASLAAGEPVLSLPVFSM